jgi:hypothetical protein
VLVKEIHEHIEVVGSDEVLFAKVCCFRHGRGDITVVPRRCGSLTVACLTKLELSHETHFQLDSRKRSGLHFVGLVIRLAYYGISYSRDTMSEAAYCDKADEAFTG